MTLLKQQKNVFIAANLSSHVVTTVYRFNCSLRISSFFSRHRFQIAIDVLRTIDWQSRYRVSHSNWLHVSYYKKNHFPKSIWSDTRYLEIVIRRSQERMKKDLLVITSNSLRTRLQLLQLLYLRTSLNIICLHLHFFTELLLTFRKTRVFKICRFVC